MDEKDNRIEKFNENTPFILLTRIKVKPDKINEYLELAEKTHKKVKELEPGMLYHTFDNDLSQGRKLFLLV
jgi:quinol monooxygenase YgiN